MFKVTKLIVAPDHMGNCSHYSDTYVFSDGFEFEAGGSAYSQQYRDDNGIVGDNVFILDTYATDNGVVIQGYVSRCQGQDVLEHRSVELIEGCASEDIDVYTLGTTLTCALFGIQVCKYEPGILDQKYLILFIEEDIYVIKTDWPIERLEEEGLVLKTALEAKSDPVSETSKGVWLHLHNPSLEKDIILLARAELRSRYAKATEDIYDGVTNDVLYEASNRTRSVELEISTVQPESSDENITVFGLRIDRLAHPFDISGLTAPGQEVILLAVDSSASDAWEAHADSTWVKEDSAQGELLEED